MNKTIEQLFQKKVDSFKEKNVLESTDDWCKENLIHLIILLDIKKIKNYFLPFKIEVLDFTAYTDQVIIIFNNKRYTIKINDE
jgi:hypothetical protein